MKIGSEFIVKEERKLQSILDENITTTKVGDKALVTKNGIKYLTGENAGYYVFQSIDDKVYDTDNIAKRIADRLYLNNMIDDDVEEPEMIEDVIDSILFELQEFI